MIVMKPVAMKAAYIAPAQAAASRNWLRMANAMGPKKKICHEKPCLTKRVWLFLEKWMFMVGVLERQRAPRPCTLWDDAVPAPTRPGGSAGRSGRDFSCAAFAR
ncbi:hypothetical protein D3C71_1532140 [compost metagenome]